jgi:hypothetical protein
LSRGLGVDGLDNRPRRSQALRIDSVKEVKVRDVTRHNLCPLPRRTSKALPWSTDARPRFTWIERVHGPHDGSRPEWTPES